MNVEEENWKAEKSSSSKKKTVINMIRVIIGEGSFPKERTIDKTRLVEVLVARVVENLV